MTGVQTCALPIFVAQSAGEEREGAGAGAVALGRAGSKHLDIYKAVLSENSNVDFIEMPHLAVSGKISFGKTKNFIGTDMVDLMYRALE